MQVWCRRLARLLLLTLLLLAFQAAVLRLGRWMSVRLVVELALGSAAQGSRDLREAVEGARAGEEEGSGAGEEGGEVGCGWTEATLLEDQDDQARGGAGAELPLLGRTLVLGYPQTGVESLSRLLASYPASLLAMDPQMELGGEAEQDPALAASQSAVLLARLFQCDLGVVQALGRLGRLGRYGAGEVGAGLAAGPDFPLDSLLVATTHLRLPALLPWLAGNAPNPAPRLRLLHLVRHPRPLLAERLGRAALTGKPLGGEAARAVLTAICSDYREDLASLDWLGAGRVRRIQYEAGININLAFLCGEDGTCPQTNTQTKRKNMMICRVAAQLTNMYEYRSIN